MVVKSAALPSTTLSTTETQGYRYAPEGMRTEKIRYDDQGGVISRVRYVYAGMDLIAEVPVTVNSAGVVTAAELQKSYVWRPGGVGRAGRLLQITDHVTHRVALAGYDGRGNLTTWTDGSTGELLGGRDYNPWGDTWIENWSNASAKTSFGGAGFGYSTEYKDETGLIYYGFRYYSPERGRFLSRDPLGESASGVNLYAFCGNDPVNRRDLFGLCTYVQGGSGQRYRLPKDAKSGDYRDKDGNIYRYDAENGSIEKADTVELPPFPVNASDSDDKPVGWAGGSYINSYGGRDLPDSSDHGGGTGSDTSKAPKGKDPNKTKPPCSQLKKGLENGTYRPTLTSNSFIPDKEVGIPGIVTWEGDGRGFLDSPSDGTPGRTSRMAVSVSYDPNSFSPTPSFQMGQSTRWLFGGLVTTTQTGHPSSLSGYSTYSGSSVTLGLAYSGSNPLAPYVVNPGTGNPNNIRMQAAVSLDSSTGMLTGTYNRSMFPAGQLFFDGQSIAKLPASNLGPAALMAVNEKGQINGVQVCDPSK